MTNYMYTVGIPLAVWALLANKPEYVDSVPDTVSGYKVRSTLTDNPELIAGALLIALNYKEITQRVSGGMATSAASLDQ